MPVILLVTETHGRGVSTQVIGDRLDDYIAYVISEYNLEPNGTLFLGVDLQFYGLNFPKFRSFGF